MSSDALALSARSAPTAELDSVVARIERRLRSLRRQLWSRVCMRGLGLLLLTAAFLFLATLLLDRWLRFTFPMRLTLSAGALAALGYLAYRILVVPLRGKFELLDLATALDRYHPGLAQRVAVVLQLPNQTSDRHGPSPAMIRQAVFRDAEIIENARLEGLLDDTSTGRHFSALLLALVIPLAMVLLAPNATRIWFSRWALGANTRWPQNSYLGVVGVDENGRLYAPRGEPITLAVTASPEFLSANGAWLVQGRGAPLRVEQSQRPISSPPEYVHLTYQVEQGRPSRGVFTRFGADEYRYDLPAAMAPKRLDIAGGDDWLEPITVQPIDRPSLASLTLRAKQPGQSDENVLDVLAVAGHVSFLQDTQLEATIVGSTPLKAMTCVTGNGVTPAFARKDERTFSATWTLKETQTLEIQLTDEVTGLTSKPYFLPLMLIKDREPKLTVRSSGVGRRITPMARIPLNLQVTDDFGIAKVEWELESVAPMEKQPTKKVRQLPAELPAKSPNADPNALLGVELQVQQLLGIRDFGFVPGTALRLRAVAEDRCAQGKQQGASRWLAFQVTTPDELFYEILSRQRLERGKFKQAVDSAKTQIETLEAPITPEASAQLLRRHQAVARQVTQTANRLDATLAEMTYNELGTPQARQILETKIIQPLREIPTEKLDPQLKQLDALIATPKPTQEKITEAVTTQREIAQTLQKILDEMSQWESFVDVVNQLKEIITMQNNLQETTKKARKEREKGIFEE